jgi:hypothetical protein
MALLLSSLIADLCTEMVKHYKIIHIQTFFISAAWTHSSFTSPKLTISISYTFIFLLLLYDLNNAATEKPLQSIMSDNASVSFYCQVSDTGSVGWASSFKMAEYLSCPGWIKLIKFLRMDKLFYFVTNVHLYLTILRHSDIQTFFISAAWTHSSFTSPKLTISISYTFIFLLLLYSFKMAEYLSCPGWIKLIKFLRMDKLFYFYFKLYTETIYPHSRYWVSTLLSLCITCNCLTLCFVGVFPSQHC